MRGRDMASQIRRPTNHKVVIVDFLHKLLRTSCNSTLSTQPCVTASRSIANSETLTRDWIVGLKRVGAI